MADFIKSGTTQLHVFINLDFVTDIELAENGKSLYFHYSNERKVEWKYENENELEDDLNLVKHRSADKYKNRQSGFRIANP